MNTITGIITYDLLKDYQRLAVDTFAQYNITTTNNVNTLVNFWKYQWNDLQNRYIKNSLAVVYTKNFIDSNYYDKSASDTNYYTKSAVNDLLEDRPTMTIGTNSVDLEVADVEIANPVATVPTVDYMQRYVADAIAASGGSHGTGIRYMGSVMNYTALLSQQGVTAGDMWNVRQDQTIDGQLYPGNMNYIAYVERGSSTHDVVTLNLAANGASSIDSSSHETFKVSLYSGVISVPAGGLINYAPQGIYDDDYPGTDLTSQVESFICDPTKTQVNPIDSSNIYIQMDGTDDVWYWQNTSDTSKNVILGVKVPVGHFGVSGQLSYVNAEDNHIAWDPQSPIISINEASTLDILNLFVVNNN